MASTTSLEGNGLDTLLHHHLQRQDQLAAASLAAHAVLKREMLEALQRDPRRTVETPGFRQARQTAIDVVADEFAGSDGNALLDTLLRICARSAAQGDVMAQSWIEVMAERHAKFHADDYADQLAGRV